METVETVMRAMMVRPSTRLKPGVNKSSRSETTTVRLQRGSLLLGSLLTN